MGRPGVAGAIHVTSSLVDGDKAAVVTVGAAGASGGSSTSITSIVTSIDAVASSSVTITVTS